MYDYVGRSRKKRVFSEKETPFILNNLMDYVKHDKMLKLSLIFLQFRWETKHLADGSMEID